jgi:outer membrane protein assembly factor BamB
MKDKIISWGVPIGVTLICVAILLGLVMHERRMNNFPERPLNVEPAKVQQNQNVTQTPAPTPATPFASTATAPTQQTSYKFTGVNVTNLPGSWPCFRGPNHDDISPEKVALSTDWQKNPPRLLWSLNLGEGYASAAIEQGKVYVLDYDEAHQEDALRCLSLANGQEIWRQSYPDPIKRNHGMSRTIPAVSGKYVVSLGPQCHVLCANADTGKIYWQMDLVKQFGTTVPQWYAGQCPLIDGNNVILAPAGNVLMIAVNLATGKIVWRTPNPMGWQMTHSSIAEGSFHNQSFYVYCGSGGAVGVSAKDGSIFWQTTDWKVSTATVPTPICLPDGRIFFTGGYGAGSAMMQMTEQGGKFSIQTLYRLTPDVFGSDQQTPILYKGYIYGVRSGGELVCLNLNGQPQWTSGATRRFGLGPYLIADGLIFIMNDSGVLTMVQATPTAYHEMGDIQILSGPDSWGPMAIAGGLLIARDLNRMVCLDMRLH